MLVGFTGLIYTLQPMLLAVAEPEHNITKTPRTKEATKKILAFNSIH
jgi:hypothetical protein